MAIKFNKILCLLIFCNLFMSIGGVSAFDNVGNHHIEELLNEHNNGDNAVVINQAHQNKEFVNNSSTTNTVGTFKDLKEKIKEGVMNHQEIIELDKDYKYDENEDNEIKSGILLSPNITIDGNGHTIDGSGLVRVFRVLDESSDNLTIKNINFQNTHATYGGVLYLRGINCKISNCHFSNSYSYQDGGAIFSESANLIIESSNFTNNSADNRSGAIYSTYGNITTISDSYFSGNHAWDTGGVIYCQKNNLNIKNSTFENNDCSGSFLSCRGGAICCSSNHITLNDSKFINNNVYDYGGAIYSLGDINSNNCLFKNNSASDNDGGAIYCEGSIKSNSDNFTGNSAYEDGGAIFCKGDVGLDNSTFADNSANGAKISQCEGGAIFCQDGSVDAVNSIFNSNSAYDYGGAIWTNKDITLNGCYFNGNSASDNDGGAIYMDDDYTLRSYNCTFINNHANDRGGAIFCDSISSRTYLEDNNFINNYCGSHKGSVAFTCGSFDIIHSNWWDDVSPDWASGLLWENTWHGHKIHQDDSPRTQPVG